MNQSLTSAKTVRNRARRQRRKALRKQKGLPANPPRGGRARPSQPRSRVTPLQNTVRVSDCTKVYASALVDPFGPMTTLPCLPDAIVLPSHKYMARVRGVFSTGTAGVGWIVFNPDMASANNRGYQATEVTQPVVYTNTGYQLNTYTYAVAAGALTTVGVAAVNSNSPYTVAQISAVQVQYRTVAAGLKIRYIGTDFRNQGRIILYRSQGNIQIPHLGTLDGTGLLQDNYAVSVPVSRKSEYVFYIPDDPSAIAYNGDTTNYNNLRYAYLIYVDGGDTTTPQSWEFEAISYYELVGPTFTLSKSEADPVGEAATMASLPTKAPTTTPSVQKAQILGKIAKYIANTASQVITTAIGGTGSRMISGALALGSANLLRPVQGTRYLQEATIEDADE